MQGILLCVVLSCRQSATDCHPADASCAPLTYLYFNDYFRFAKSAGSVNSYYLVLSDAKELYRSTNGTTWERITYTATNAIVDAGVTSGKVLVGVDGASDRVYRSTDFGSTWSEQDGPGTNFAQKIAVCGTRVVVADNNSSAVATTSYYSTDEGLSFTTGGFMNNTGTMNSITCEGTNVFADTGGAWQVARSTDGGNTYSLPTSFGLNAQNVSGPGAAVSSDGNSVAALAQSTGTRFLFSTDAGDNYSYPGMAEISGGNHALGTVGGKFVLAAYVSACEFRTYLSGAAYEFSPSVACPAAGNTMYAVGGGNGLILAGGRECDGSPCAGTNFPQLFQSSDAGASFSRVSLPVGTATAVRDVLYSP